jgi:hypothetical protein
MSTGAVFFAHKKRITERNSHLAREASGSSISNGCQTKTERRRQLAGVETGRGGTKLHASVTESRVTAFLATAAPWEPYITDNTRIYLSIWHSVSERYEHSYCNRLINALNCSTTVHIYNVGILRISMTKPLDTLPALSSIRSAYTHLACNKPGTVASLPIFLSERTTK